VDSERVVLCDEILKKLRSITPDAGYDQGNLPSPFKPDITEVKFSTLCSETTK
jgi:hypothetical protein